MDEMRFEAYVRMCDGVGREVGGVISDITTAIYLPPLD